MMRSLVSKRLAGLILACACMLPSLSAETVSAEIVDVSPEKMTFTILSPELGEEPVTVMAGLGDLEVYQAGDRVRGELVPYGKTKRLQTIWPADSVSVGTMQTIGQQLKRDTLRRGSRVFRGVGERMPRFALWDQNGELFLSDSLRGKYVVMNFIFTRCPIETMCPASTQRMKELQAAARKRGWDDLRLVSVSLDPEYDTPGIFTSYAHSKGIPTDNFSFLSGPPEITDALERQMGILAEEDPEQIVRHTISTALIDPNGKIIYRIPGSSWSPEAFLKAIERDREENGQS